MSCVTAGLLLAWGALLGTGGLAAELPGGSGPGDLIFVLSGPNDEPINREGGPNDDEPINRDTGCEGGPNDDEPINALELSVFTNYRGHASVSIEVDGAYLQSQPVTAGATIDPDTGLQRSPLRIDLGKARELTGRDYLSPDSEPLVVSARLVDPWSYRIITVAEWKGCVGRPWLDLQVAPPRATGEEGEAAGTPCGGAPGVAETALPGMVPCSVHTLPEDSYFFVFVSTSRDALKLSPEDPGLYRAATIALGRSLYKRAPETHTALLRTDLDSSGSPVHAVAWSYDDERGWKRSPIVSVTSQE